MNLQSRFPEFLRTDNRPDGYFLEETPRLIFHHLPKTAGSTFRRFLESLFDPQEVCPHEIDDEIKALSEDEWRRYRMFAGHFSYDLLNRFFCDDIRIVFLRDPVERIVSNFHNLRDPERYQPQWIERARSNPAVQENLELIQSLTLSEFIRDEHTPMRDRVCNFQTRRLLTSGRRKQLSDDAWPDFDANMLDEAKLSLRSNFHFVGLQELFGLSLQLFSMTFGLTGFRDSDAYSTNINPAVGGGRSESYRRTLDPEDLAYLEARNRMDAELVEFGRSLLLDRLERFLAHDIEAAMLLRLNRRAANTTRAAMHQKAWLRVSAEEIRSCRGLHRLEYDGHRKPFRWTGYESPVAIWLELDVSDAASIELEIEYLDVIDPSVLRTLAVWLNGIEGTIVDRSPGWVRVRVERPPGDPARFVHLIQLESGVVGEPEEAPFPRNLGFALHALTLSSSA